MTPVSQTSSDRSSTTSLDRAKQLATTLLSERSQASGAKAARLLHELLGILDAGDRHVFQHYLATEFQPDGFQLVYGCPQSSTSSSGRSRSSSSGVSSRRGSEASTSARAG